MWLYVRNKQLTNFLEQAQKILFKSASFGIGIL